MKKYYVFINELDKLNLWYAIEEKVKNSYVCYDCDGEELDSREFTDWEISYILNFIEQAQYDVYYSAAKAAKNYRKSKKYEELINGCERHNRRLYYTGRVGMGIVYYSICAVKEWRSKIMKKYEQYFIVKKQFKVFKALCEKCMGLYIFDEFYIPYYRSGNVSNKFLYFERNGNYGKNSDYNGRP